MEIRLTEDDKRLFFDRLLSSEFEEIIRIDQKTGAGTTVYAIDNIWEKTVGVDYDFQETMQNYLHSCSADSNTERLIEKVDLAYIRDQLGKSGKYKLSYALRDEKGVLRIKKASFFQKQGEHVWLVIRDITDDFENVIENVSDLEYAFKNTNHELDKKNEFLNLMSRNIRAPLHSIMGLTKIARDHPEDNTSLDAYLHKISMSGTYMSETIDDILDLRRIANRDISLNPKPIEMQEFLGNICRLIQPECDDKDLIFSMKADVSSDLVVKADSHALQQILMKLLQSAMNYTVRGGRIQLNAHEVFRKEDEVTVEFSVECLGIVIDQERLKTLFKPYNYLLEKVEEDIGSLDIALIILKSYALAMGTDTLMAESDASRGTKVSLSLTMPLADDTKAREKLAMEKLLPKLKGLRVLIVDDNEVNLEVGEKILLSEGIDVVSAINGQDALNIYTKENGRFDLILMDIIMPVMDGLEATRQIRALKDVPGSDKIPIIAMTANALRENFEESFRSGMNAHLVKPISPERLFSVMGEALAGTMDAD